MITAEISRKDTLITKVSDENGKEMTICSSKTESPYLSPRQLVQSALAGCLSMTVRKEFMNSGTDFSDVKVLVDMKETDGKYSFIYQILIASSADEKTVDELKNKAVSECFIKGLLSSDPEIIEGEVTPSAALFDRCCD